MFGKDMHLSFKKIADWKRSYLAEKMMMIETLLSTFKIAQTQSVSIYVIVTLTRTSTSLRGEYHRASNYNKAKNPIPFISLVNFSIFFIQTSP